MIPAPLLFPSLSCVHPLHLEDALQATKHYVTGYHLDIADATITTSFEGNIALIEYLASRNTYFLWIHVMMENPLKIIHLLPPFTGMISFQYEIKTDIITQTIAAIKNRAPAVCVSIALAPHTPVHAIIPHLNDIDDMLIMGVNPGRSGQTMVRSTINRLIECSQLIQQLDKTITLSCDGGITLPILNSLVQQPKISLHHCALGSALFALPATPHSKEEVLQGWTLRCQQALAITKTSNTLQ